MATPTIEELAKLVLKVGDAHEHRRRTHGSWAEVNGLEASLRSKARDVLANPPKPPADPLRDAAPALLASCRGLLAIVRLQNGNLHDDTNALQAKAEAAIAKAEPPASTLFADATAAAGRSALTGGKR